MGDFGARQHFPTYVGGGDLWEEPIRELRWFECVDWAAITWLAIAACFFFVGLTFYLSE